jgi:hypothetical protein
VNIVAPKADVDNNLIIWNESKGGRNTASLTEILEAEQHYKLTTSFLKEHNLQIKGKDNKKPELKNSIMQFQTRAIYQIYLLLGHNQGHKIY